MTPSGLTPSQTLTVPLFGEPMRVETVQPNGMGAWTVGPVGFPVGERPFGQAQ
jgi:hypothetical protein